jgi:DNA-binding MarR family transcriptional regulator
MSKENREDLLSALVDANRRYQQGTDAIDQAACELIGINRTDARCIDILQVAGGMSAGELAEAAGLSPGAVTAVLDHLEQAGLAERVGDPHDRRRVLVQPTQYSYEVAGRIYGPLGERGVAAVAELSDDELRAITEFLERGAELQRRRAGELREWLEREGPLRSRG